MIFNVCKPLVVESPIATFITVFLAAINQLLFGQVDRLPFHEGERFQRANSTEGPTRPALPLVLNGGDLALSGPIDVPAGLGHEEVYSFPLGVEGFGVEDIHEDL